MRRERAALALFSLGSKQARPAREPDGIFDRSALSIQQSEPLVAFRPSLFARGTVHAMFPKRPDPVLVS